LLATVFATDYDSDLEDQWFPDSLQIAAGSFNTTVVVVGYWNFKWQEVAKYNIMPEIKKANKQYVETDAG